MIISTVNFGSILKQTLHYGVFAGICITFDNVFILMKTRKLKVIPSSRIALSIFDNAAHGFIALYAWLLATEFQFSKRNMALTFICMMVACLVDIDHFLVAGSWKLKDALSLKSRPPFHCSTILLPYLIFLILGPTLGSHLFKKKLLVDSITLTFVALATHHLRDATRRGLWLCPFGSTKPLTMSVYLLSMISVPFFVRIYRQFVNTVVLNDVEKIV